MTTTLQGWCFNDFANVFIDESPLALRIVVHHFDLVRLLIAKPLFVEAAIEERDRSRVKEVDHLAKKKYIHVGCGTTMIDDRLIRVQLVGRSVSKSIHGHSLYSLLWRNYDTNLCLSLWHSLTRKPIGGLTVWLRGRWL